jgi:hypothetical protein
MDLIAKATPRDSEISYQLLSRVMQGFYSANSP